MRCDAIRCKVLFESLTVLHDWADNDVTDSRAEQSREKEGRERKELRGVGWGAVGVV